MRMPDNGNAINLVYFYKACVVENLGRVTSAPL